MSTAGNTTTTPATGDVYDPLAGTVTGKESSLSSWAGPYVTDMLGRGQALAQTPFQTYTGPLTAGYTAPQTAAFSGIAGLTVPTEQMGAFTPTSFTAQDAQTYMSPYLQASLNPQLDEARRQAQISRLADATRLTKAGAFGGSRQAIMESEGQRNLLRNLADITGTGYQRAFEQAQQQFNVEQGRQQTAMDAANRYGLEALQQQATMGAQERGIEQEALNAARAQFEEERLFPYKQLQFQQSLLQGMPLAAQAYSYQQPSGLAELLGGTEGILGLFKGIFGGGSTTPTPTPPPATTPPATEPPATNADGTPTTIST